MTHVQGEQVVLVSDVLEAISAVNNCSEEHKMLTCMIKMLGRINQQEAYLRSLEDENISLKQTMRMKIESFQKVAQEKRTHKHACSRYQLQTQKILTIGRPLVNINVQYRPN
jgi:hypothetical protein